MLPGPPPNRGTPGLKHIFGQEKETTKKTPDHSQVLPVFFKPVFLTAFEAILAFLQGFLAGFEFFGGGGDRTKTLQGTTEEFHVYPRIT